MRTILIITITFLAGLGIGYYLDQFIPSSVPMPLRGTLPDRDTHVVGFLPFWLLDRAEGQYPDITTLAYFALQLNTDGTIRKLDNPQEEEPGWTTLKSSRIRRRFEQAQTESKTLSLVIHQSDEQEILELLQDPETHGRNLVEDAVPIMNDYGFIDLNLDIESFTTATPQSRQQFATFIKTVNTELKKRGKYTLTVEITPISLIKTRLTDLKLIAPYPDHMILMAYDFHYSGSFTAGPTAPLGGAGVTREFDVTAAITEALRDIEPNRLIMGIPLYGYEWKTLDNRPGSSVIPGLGATASTERVTELLKDCSDCRRGFNHQARQPYVIIPQDGYYHQIFYENKASFTNKLKTARTFGLHGVALWALGYENDQVLSALSRSSL